MSTDPLSFLDQKSDPLSFLDETKEDVLSFLDTKAEEPIQAKIEAPQQKSLWDKFGQGLAIQSQTSQAVTPQGASAIVKQLPAGVLEGITLGAVDLAHPTEEGEQVIREVGKLWGLTGPISLINKALSPVYALARSSPIAPKAIEAFARLTGAGVTGATVATGQKYFKEGELPSKEELLKEGATWMAIDAVLQAVGVGARFGQAVSNIAKQEGVPKREVLSKLWESTKNFFKDKLKSKTISPDEIIEPVAEQMVKEAEKLAEELKPIEVEPINTKEPEAIKPKKPKEKPKKVPELPEVNLDSLDSIPRHMYEEQIGRIKAYKAGKEVGPDGWPMPPLSAIYSDLSDAHYLPPKVQERYAELAKAQLFEEAKQKAVKAMDRAEKEESQETAKSSALTRQNLLEREKPLPKKVRTRPQEKLLAEKRPVVGAKQAKKRSEILDIFRKAFTDPIRLKKIRQRNALGIHKLWPKVTRLLKDNDIETAAHEIGHNLHTTLYGGNAKTPTEQRVNIGNALRPYLGELKPLALYEPWGMEGFAEFTRLYVTNPDIAKQLAPKFYEKFENDLDASYPEMKVALLKAREYYDEYLQGTPESRIESQISYAKPEGFIDKIGSAVGPEMRDKLKFMLLDDLYPLKRMVADLYNIKPVEVENLKDEANVYRAARVMKGAIGKADVFLEHETFDFFTLEKTGKSYKSILEGLSKQELKEFNLYRVAKRAIEKTGQRLETGIELGDAVATVNKYKEKYEPIAKRMYAFYDRLLKYHTDSGMESEETRKLIKSKNLFYTPWDRVLHPESEGSLGGASSSRLQAKKIIKKFKGSSSEIIDPYESDIKRVYSLILEAEKNRVGQILVKLAQEKPNAGKFVERIPPQQILKAKFTQEELVKKIMAPFTIKTNEGTVYLVDPDEVETLLKLLPESIERWGTVKPAGNVITVYDNGKPTYYEVSPDIYKVWEQGLAPYSADLITKVLRIPAKTLRAGAILNPRFIQKNVVRDTWAGALFTKYGSDGPKMLLDVLYEPIKGVMIAAGKGQLYIDWMKSGGGLGTMQSLDRLEVVKKLSEVREGLKPHQVIGWLRKIAGISEEANRIAEFGRALKVEGQTRIGREIAAFAARDISIDYAKIGLLTKSLNQIIPFWNATVQGGDKFIRSLGNPEDRGEFLKRLVILVAIPSLLLAVLNQNNEDIDEQSESTKDFNFLFPWFGHDVVKIPVPFEAGVLVHSLMQRMYKWAIKREPDAFSGLLKSFKDVAIPEFIPSAVNPFIEAWANKSFFTNRRIIPMGKEKLIPELQYKNWTSTTARLLSRAISYMVGPEKASVYTSPAIIDHFVNAWFGGLGNQTIKILDAAFEAAGAGDQIPKPDQPIIDRLGLNAFIQRFPNAGSNSVEKFYENYEKATKIHRSLKIAKQEGEPQRYRKIEKLDTYPKLQAAYKAMQRSQKAINMIHKDPDLTSEQKKSMIDELYLQQIRFSKAANDDIRLYLQSLE
jgi:hypothetical protein